LKCKRSHHDNQKGNAIQYIEIGIYEIVFRHQDSHQNEVAKCGRSHHNNRRGFSI
jgi:hypothetical protein